MMPRPFGWGLRILAIALCLAALMSTAQPVNALPETAAATAQTNTQQPETTAVYTYTTVLHWKASYSSLVIGRMEDGEQVFVKGTSGSFYKIDSFGLTAYVAKSQVEQREDGNYYVSCDPDSSETKKMELINKADALALRTSVLQTTKKQLGYPYVYGGTRPGGFDCSGLTWYVYRQNGIAIRRGGGSQPGDGIAVAKEDLQVGDLVFFRVAGDKDFMSHVGIYVGNNQIIHSGSRGVGYASLDNAWFANNYLCARRVVLENASVVSLLPSISADNVMDYNRETGGLRTAD